MALTVFLAEVISFIHAMFSQVGLQQIFDGSLSKSYSLVIHSI